jgi:hypothetical protein
MTPASPPITLLDSSQTIFLKARQSNLRRYFFASPCIYICLNSLDATAPLPADGEEEVHLLGKSSLDVQPLLKNGFFEVDVDIPVPYAKEPAKVHLVLWLERLEPDEMLPVVRGHQAYKHTDPRASHKNGVRAL